jgi:hypothetical protein
MGIVCVGAVHFGEVAVSESLCRGVGAGALLRWSDQRRTEGCVCRVGLGLDGLWCWYDNGEICSNVLVSGRYGLGGFGKSLLHEVLGVG